MRKLTLLILAIIVLFSCSKDETTFTYKNGTYKAVEAEYAYGWKGYLNISIGEDKLTSVDFDYLNEDGNKKSETSTVEYPMDPHPSVWLPQYDSSLMSSDILNYSDIDAISGATHSGETVNKMMEVLLEAAKTGDTSEQVLSED